MIQYLLLLVTPFEISILGTIDEVPTLFQELVFMGVMTSDDTFIQQEIGFLLMKERRQAVVPKTAILQVTGSYPVSILESHATSCKDRLSLAIRSQWNDFARIGNTQRKSFDSKTDVADVGCKHEDLDLTINCPKHEAKCKS